MKKFIFYWIPVIVYALIIFFFSSIPLTAEQMPGPEFLLKDKILHTAEFFILAFLFLRVFVKEKWKMPFYFAVLFTILYGALDELHQLFVPGRVTSFVDLVFNMIGALLVLVFKVLER